MSVDALIKTAETLGVELWVEGERLRFRAPRGVVNAELRAAIGANREQVIAALRHEAESRTDDRPLSHGQRSLWFLHKSMPDSAAYNVGFSVRIACEVNRDALRHAIQSLVDRHASLRTTYPLVDGLPVQRIAGAVRTTIGFHDMAGANERELRAMVKAEISRSFDIERGPIFRAKLCSSAADDHILLFAMHHISGDGWSVGVLLDELRQLYGEVVEGGLAPPRPALQFSDVAARKAEMLAGPAGRRMSDYWMRQLAAPRAVAQLPSTRRRPGRKLGHGEMVRKTIESDFYDRLQGLARRLKTTPFVMLLAAFKVLLFRYTGVTDIIVGTPSHGRGAPEYAPVVGNIVNTLPLRTRLHADRPFQALTDSIRQTLIEGMEAEEFPFSLIVQQLHPERDASRSPLFETLFALLRINEIMNFDEAEADPNGDGSIPFGALRVKRFEVGQGEGQFDFMVQMIDSGRSLVVELKYSPDLYDAGEIETFYRNYLAVLEHVMSDLAATPASVPLDLPELRESAADLIERLRSLDVRLELQDGRLRARLQQRREELIEALTNARATSATPAGAPTATAAQLEMWRFDKAKGEGAPSPTRALVFRRRGRLDVDALARAFRKLVARHDALRMRFAPEADGLRLHTSDDAAAPLIAEDLSNLPASMREAAAESAIGAFLDRPTDLLRGPLAGLLHVVCGEEDHQLVLAAHPIVMDGAALAIAANELACLYASEAEGRGLELAPAMQAADLAALERSRIIGGEFASQIAYWRRILADAPTSLVAPADRARGPVRRTRGGRLSRAIDAGLLARVEAFARDRAVTTADTFRAAWLLLLHRWTGQDDLLVATPVARRASEGAVVGCVENYVVLRSRLGVDHAFADFLADATTVAAEAMRHADVPLGVVADAVGAERAGPHAPLAQLLFAFAEHADEVAPVGFERAPPPAHALTLTHDLALEIRRTAEGAKLKYDYADDQYEQRTIARLHDMLVALIDAATASPGAKARELPILAAADRDFLLGAMNDTDLPHDRMRLVHALMEKTARRAPDAIAATDGRRVVRYRELDVQANRLAHRLIARGVRPGDIVAVCLNRTVDMPIALAAVLKTGAAYAPLDPTHPRDRLRYIIKDSGARCAVTLDRFAPIFDELCEVLALDAMESDPSAPSAAPDVAIAPSDLAYVIYTSGSTGQPKGVEVEHRNVVSFLEAMSREPGLTQDDTLLAVTTLSFDIAGLEIWLPMMVGARIVVAASGDALDGRRMIELLETEGVTLLQATPATWRVMIEAGWRGSTRLKALCGGEAMPRDLAAALASRTAELWNMYGPTETTIWSACERVADPRAPITIGRPIANTRIYVFEPSGALAPIGVFGELCIAGEGVARGYRGRPELTAEKFGDAAASGGRCERIYRTGDVARILADGRIEFLGRRDTQVKLRGYRIELGEIEAMLAAQPGVKGNAVAVREDSPGDQRLVAYVVEAAVGAFAPDAARSALRAALPEYMIPNLFIPLPALPLTPNSKIDRNALPAPQPAAAAANHSDAVMTPAQGRVAALWRSVLGLERVGLDDNFFDLGGHSWLLVKLHVQLKREFETQFPLVELFQRTTVAAQAGLFSAAKPADVVMKRARARAMRQVYG